MCCGRAGKDREAKVASEPEALVSFFEALAFAVKQIGLEAGPLSQWLHAGLKRVDSKPFCWKRGVVGDDGEDGPQGRARLAQLIRMGWFRPVHAKSIGSQEVRALLVARCGDEMMRMMLYEAAQIVLVRSTKWSWLKAWAMKIARHRGVKKAIVALARRLAVIMHRIWVDGTEFRWTREVAA